MNTYGAWTPRTLVASIPDRMAINVLRAFQTVRSIGILVFLSLIAATGIYAQTQPLRGRVLDPAGAPIAGQRVILHNVTDTGGAALAEATTDEDGRFSLETGSATDGLFFLATQWDGELRIGPVLRAPLPTDEYVFSMATAATPAIGPAVGVPTTVAPATGAQPGRNRGGQIAFAVAGLLTLVAAAAWVAQRATRPSDRQQLLAQLARIEERSVPYKRGERARLIERLR